MAVLQLKYMGDPFLRKKAMEIEPDEIDSVMDKLIGDMIETMYTKDGVGLAAPQVGVGKRLIVYDNVEAGYQLDPQVLINPVIIEEEGSCRGEEGCLSIPEIKEMVERAERIVVRGLDREGGEVEIEATDMVARIIQHEVDHLDGILFVDLLGGVKKKLAVSRWKKVRKELEARQSA
ncbi:MAG: peptide deformylase [Candidatus Glassbacteria bacterium]|nr:peptide deformylase [Candidatus Glassbacteria bacterium]